MVLEESVRVLDAAGFEADYVEGDIGWEFWCTEGNPLPQRTLDLIAEQRQRQGNLLPGVLGQGNML